MTRLRLLRLQRGLEQRELANILGIGQSLLSRLEHRWFTRCPNQAVIERSLRAFFGPDESFESLMQEAEPDRTPAAMSA